MQVYHGLYRKTPIHQYLIEEIVEQEEELYPPPVSFYEPTIEI
jgi:hypothetical protein